MTKKHFEAIAARLADQMCAVGTPNERAMLTELAIDLAADFAAFNPHFNRDRFLTAAGVHRVHQ